MKPGEGGRRTHHAHPSPLPREPRVRTGPPAHFPTPDSIDPPLELSWGSAGVTQEGTLLDPVDVLLFRTRAVDPLRRVGFFYQHLTLFSIQLQPPSLPHSPPQGPTSREQTAANFGTT